MSKEHVIDIKRSPKTLNCFEEKYEARKKNQN